MKRHPALQALVVPLRHHQVLLQALAHRPQAVQVAVVHQVLALHLVLPAQTLHPVLAPHLAPHLARPLTLHLARPLTHQIQAQLPQAQQLGILELIVSLAPTVNPALLEISKGKSNPIHKLPVQAKMLATLAVMRQMALMTAALVALMALLIMALPEALAIKMLKTAILVILMAVPQLEHQTMVPVTTLLQTLPMVAVAVALVPALVQ